MTPSRGRVPVPSRPADVELGPVLDAVHRSAAGFPGGDLLRDVSVARAASVLLELLVDGPAAVQRLLAGLDEFCRLQPERQLAPVLARAWNDRASADRCLADAVLRRALDDVDAARLGFGPKLWFTLNGVAVRWRPLLVTVPRGPARVPARSGAQARWRPSDLGRLCPGAVFRPDPLAEPMLLRVWSGDGGPDRFRLLDHAERSAAVAALREAAGRAGGEPVG